MWSLGINTRDQETHTIRSLAVVLCVSLCAVADARCDFGEEDGPVVGEARGERLLFHEVGEHTGVGGETGQTQAIVSVDWDDLALV